MPHQNLVLVVLDRGMLALVAASPDKFTDLASLPAINGKPWDHPALVDDDGRFRLGLAGG